MDITRQALIRLAHAHPELRSDLLPLVAAGPSADARYRAQVQHARTRLQQIEAHITAHEQKQKHEPENWGYVGDMASIEESLSDLLTGLLETTR